MTTWQDAAGNQFGRLDGIATPDAPALLLGSHLDTVPDAGRFDGIVGVLMALEVVRLLRAPRADGWISPLPFALEVVAFSDEEGTRFGKALLGSSAVAGTWDDDWWDADGCRRHDAARGVPRVRPRPRPHRRGRAAARRAGRLPRGAHRAGARARPAAASRSRSSRRSRARAASSSSIEGEARHAGGTPYDMRRDALLGASEAALAVERICRGEHHIIGTVGQLEAFPGAVNIVPGEAHLSLDLRGEYDGVAGSRVGRDRARARRHHGPPRTALAGARDPQRRRGDVRPAAARRRARGHPRDPARAAPTNRRRSSAAPGHDGMAIGAITDVGMLFLRNPDGISHHPDEAVSAGDVVARHPGARRVGPASRRRTTLTPAPAPADTRSRHRKP